MNSSSWNRWLALAGILFAILFVVGFFMAGSIDTSESDANIISDVKDSGTQTATIAGAYLMAVAAVMLLCFAARLRTLLGEAEGGRETLAGLAFVGGGVCAALILVGAFALAAVPAALAFGSSPDPTSADAARYIPQFGFGIVLVGAMFSAIVMILSTSIVALRTGVLPTWFGWFGVVVSVVLLFGAAFFPAIALPIWAIVASILFLRSKGAAAMATA
jgi:hypothetical protein